MEKSKKSSTVQQSICNCIVVGIDGSEGSHNAFELVINDFHRKGLDKLILVHISDAKKEHEKGLQYHSKTIYNKYEEELTSRLNADDYKVIFEERKENENVFEQINDIAVSCDATLLVLGFRGYKGKKGRPDELSKGVTYLVHKPKIPVLILKEKTERLYRESGKFKWLVCLESSESKSLKALQTCARFIDTENDIVHGVHINTSGKEIELSDSPVKAAFDKVMVEFEIVNFDFTVIELDEKAGIHGSLKNWVAEHLENENHYIDFMVMGYNPTKYNFDKDAANTTVDMIKFTPCNVFFDH